MNHAYLFGGIIAVHLILLWRIARHLKILAKIETRKFKIGWGEDANSVLRHRGRK